MVSLSSDQHSLLAHMKVKVSEVPRSVKVKAESASETSNSSLTSRILRIHKVISCTTSQRCTEVQVEMEAEAIMVATII